MNYKVELSILILTWNSIGYLKNCLKSIFNNLPSCDYEIILVDNFSNDLSVEYVEKHYPSVKIIKNKKNLGVGPGRNVGFKQCIGEYIFSIDVDTKINKTTIPELLKYIKMDEKVGVCGSKLFYENGTLLRSCRPFPTVQSKFARRFPIKKIREKFIHSAHYQNYNYEEPIFVGYVIGACQMIRREVIEKLNGYDERWYYGPEDFDFCLRAWKLNFKVLYVPSSTMIHVDQRITAEVKNIFSRQTLSNVFGTFSYFMKHKYLFFNPKPEKNHFFEQKK